MNYQLTEETEAFLQDIEDFLVDQVEPEVYYTHGVAFGVGDWMITLKSNDDDGGEGVFQLFRTRRDLLIPLLFSKGYGQFFAAARPLKVWLATRNYQLGISGRTWWTKLLSLVLGV